MAAITPSQKGVTLATVGGDNDSWGNIDNTSFTAIINMLAGTSDISAAGMSNVVLSSSEAQKLIIETTGILTGNVYVLTPQPGIYCVHNLCTGAYSLSFGFDASGVPSGDTVVCPQGEWTLVICDGDDCGNPNQAAVTADTYWCGTSTGSANQQLLTPIGASLTALTAGDIFTGIAGFTNTSSTELAVSGTGGFQPCYKRTTSGPTPMTGGEIRINNAYQWLWDGSQFQIMNQV